MAEPSKWALERAFHVWLELSDSDEEPEPIIARALDAEVARLLAALREPTRELLRAAAVAPCQTTSLGYGAESPSCECMGERDCWNIGELEEGEMRVALRAAADWLEKNRG